MGNSLADWLALREPFDAAARSDALTRAIAAALPHDRPLKIVDLGAGRGSNARYLAGRLPWPQEWLLLDGDATLLADVGGLTPYFETKQMSLGTLDPAIFKGRHLVTASALLDLVSETWLRHLAARCAESRASVLFALSYDGRIDCSPEDPADAAIVSLVNEHQRTDKGFGPALGPVATDCAERCFRDRGYYVARDRSDWLLTAASPELQRQLIEGWAQAATEVAPSQTATIDAWRRRRHAHIDAKRSQIIVGHEDLAGWPL